MRIGIDIVGLELGDHHPLFWSISHWQRMHEVQVVSLISRVKWEKLAERAMSGKRWVRADKRSSGSKLDRVNFATLGTDLLPEEMPASHHPRIQGVQDHEIELFAAMCTECDLVISPNIEWQPYTSTPIVPILLLEKAESRPSKRHLAGADMI